MHVKDSELVEKLSEQLTGEELVAAAFARLTTGLSAARMLSPLGNYFIARPAARAKATRITSATDVPLDAAMILGITATELHVWAADPMMNLVHDHLGAIPLGRITSIAVEAGRTWQKVTLTLTDGTAIELEARGAAHAIAEAFATSRGSRT
jgi:hypothetical protein